MYKAIVSKIKTKKFKNLDENVILSEIKEFLRKNPKIKVDNERSKDFKKVVKHVKQRMHQNYGMFQKNVSKREKLLEKLKKVKENSSEYVELHKKILSTHKSTKERLSFYEQLYEDLFKITENPSSILDIGCGLNPFSIIFMGFNGKYIASEFNSEDNEFIEKYAKISKNNIKTVKLDLEKEVPNIKVDIVFAWKLFDVIGLKAAENVIKHLNAKYLIASFSTKTLTGKKMEFPKRIGFERMLLRLNKKYELKEYENEIFYVVKL